MTPAGIDISRPAVGIRQPWIELILSGKKTLEIRSLKTQIRGTIYLYASQTVARHPAAIKAAKRFDLEVSELPRGLLLGSVQLTDCRKTRAADAKCSCLSPDLLVGMNAWVFEDPVRFDTPIPVKYLPYGVWFYPFQRKQSAMRQKRGKKRA